MQIRFKYTVRQKCVQNSSSTQITRLTKRKTTIKYRTINKISLSARRSNKEAIKEIKVKIRKDPGIYLFSCLNNFLINHRHSEHQIGFLEEKTHKARVRKHGSNYLLETYLKGLSEAVDPSLEENPSGDRNSDSGVVTEGDSEQSNHNKPSSSVEVSDHNFFE